MTTKKEGLMIEGACCPKCSSHLQIRQFTDAWDAENKPGDIFEDLYCPKCKLRWIALEREPDEGTDER